MTRATVFVLLALGSHAPAPAQLRPPEPVPWQAFEVEDGFIEMGFGTLLDQKAALAGTEGRLHELAAFRAVWRLGRVALELAGTPVRLFDDESTFAAPAPGTRAPDGERRTDAGDFRVATTVLLTGFEGPLAGALRFGTRLPTTDNRVGLERDRTDFFAVFGGRFRHRRLRLAAEAGLGIHGTRDPDFEQVDPILYGGGVSYHVGRWRSSMVLTGRHDTRGGEDKRGNEDQSELRFGVRFGQSRWVGLTLIAGLAEFSPSAGFFLGGGAAF